VSRRIDIQIGREWISFATSGDEILNFLFAQNVAEIDLSRDLIKRPDPWATVKIFATIAKPCGATKNWSFRSLRSGRRWHDRPLDRAMMTEVEENVTGIRAPGAGILAEK
jgi:hypothetical protein